MFETFGGNRFSKPTHVVRSLINDSVVWQVGGHQQRMYVLRFEALHVGFGKVRVQIPGDVVVAGGELEPRRQVTYALI